MERYYRILGISPGASQKEVKRAYRRLAVRWHPDVNHSEGAAQKFMEINEAYEFLSSPHNQYYNTSRSNNTTQDPTPEEAMQERMKRARERYEQSLRERELENNRYRILITTGYRRMGHVSIAWILAAIALAFTMDRYLLSPRTERIVLADEARQTQARQIIKTLDPKNEVQRFTPYMESIELEYSPIFNELVSARALFHSGDRTQLLEQEHPMNLSLIGFFIVMAMSPLMSVRNISYTPLYLLTIYTGPLWIISFLIYHDRWASLLGLN